MPRDNYQEIPEDFRDRLAEASREALTAQDASNLSGVAHSLSAVLTELIWPMAQRLQKGTAWVNAHPLVTLYLDKLTDLNGYGTVSGMESWDIVKLWAGPLAGRGETLATLDMPVVLD